MSDGQQSSKLFKLADIRFVLEALSKPDYQKSDNFNYKQPKFIDLCEALLDIGFLNRSTRFKLKEANILAFDLAAKGEQLNFYLNDRDFYEQIRIDNIDGLDIDELEYIFEERERKIKKGKKERKQARKTANPPVQQDDQPAEPALQDTGEIIPNRVHDAAFLWALDYQKRNPDFRFWLRRRNTNKRLRQGFWFQGNENYASVGLYNLRSNNQSTKAIALVFWPNDQSMGVSLDLIFQGNQPPRQQAFFQDLQKLLSGVQDFAEPLKFTIKNDRARMILSFDQPFDAATEFLDRFKGEIDDLIKANDLQGSIISEEDFQLSLDRVNSYRETLIKDPHAFDEKEEEKEEELEPDQLEDEIEDDKELQETYDDSSEQSVQGRKRMAELTIVGKNGEPLLGVEELARIFTDVLIRSTGQSGTTAEEDHFYGIFGRWGRGKTYLWELIEKRINAHPDYQGKYETVPFHAWKYQQTPAIWAYLYETLASRYYKEIKGSWWARARLLIGNRYRAIRLNTERDFEQVLLSILGIAGLVISATLGLLAPSFCLPNWLILGLPGLSALSLGGGLYKMIRDPLSKKGKSFVEKYSKRPTYNKEMGIQHEIQEELRHLLKVWHKQSKKKFVLFVDDIDRCSHERIITIVDSIRVILNDAAIRQHIIVIAAIDEHILYNAIQMKYEPFVKDTTMLKRITMEYFDKLFIAGIRLSALSNDQKKAVLKGITKSITEDETTSNTPAGAPAQIPAAQGLGPALRQEQKALEHRLKTDADASKSSIDIGKALRKEADLRVKEETNIDKGAVITDDTHQISQEDQSLFQLSTQEQEMLEERVVELENATPRSIRNFTIKYRLARSMVGLRLPEIDEASEKLPNEKSLTQMWDEDIQFKRALTGYILETMNEKSQAPLELPKDMMECLRQAANTVSFNPQSFGHSSPVT